MTDTEEKIRVFRGLKGVYFDRSPTTHIDGRKGELRYWGYSIHDLATHSTFEETAYLLLHGELPSSAQLRAFDQALRNARSLPPAIIEIIRTVVDGHPMDVLRTAVSALAAFDPHTSDNSSEAVMQKTLRLTSQVPMIVAAHHRIRQGLAPIEADASLGHAAHFLYQLSGEIPSEDAARLMDLDFILHAEHGSNASSFTARVVTGTDANLHASITAAIAALSGPAHGGAAEDVMHMAREIGDPANAAEYVKRKRANKEAIMGFGHRVYRAEDPRARHLRDGVERLSIEKGEPHWNDILKALVEAMKPYSRLGVNVNVDFYSGVIYHLNGIPEDLFVPIFAIGRVPGWSLQIMQQMENNILIRPLLEYNGPDLREYVPLEQR
ncbi:Citrate synthase (si) [Aequoribacter fuscus]|uniref:Citrate synthase n=2 Tax=Aequoribacter TaxID=2847769 RepID=F3KYA0_9GAMM|nr:citrate/2-methylcitrate synthase [Aequoribacter fuscus]EGG30956.1 Citrate synthase (si) [Aequoribacter fuscus]QHJ89316.1 citrate (Si)-synthase [Aequoribacter fuscus]